MVVNNNADRTSMPLRKQLAIIWLLLLTMAVVPLYIEGMRSLIARMLRLRITDGNRSMLSLAAFTIFVLIAWCWKRSKWLGIVVQGGSLALLVIWLWQADPEPLAAWLEYAPKLIGAAVLVALVASLLAVLRERAGHITSG